MYYDMLPGFPASLKGSMLVDGYLSGKPGGKGKSYLAKKILNAPGTNQALYKYLKGSGRDRIPDIVEHHLHGKWYAKPAKMISGLPFARDIAIEKILENTLPKVKGDTSLARQFLAAGGNL
jgi:hypothetical protein